MKKPGLILLLLTAVFYGLRAQVVFTPQDDSFIYAAGARANDPYGLINPDTLKTRKSVASEEFTRETYLLFHIGPQDTTFSSARVKMYGVVAENKRVQVFATDTNWQETTLTGNNRPGGSYLNDQQLTAGTGYFEWDVTNYVNEAVKQGFQRISFIFKDIAGAVSTKDTYWHSKENPSGKAPLLELVPGPEPFHRQGTYYIDADSGDDSNTAESPQKAWKSLERINAEYFRPGDSLLFRCDRSWSGQLALKGSGLPGRPIVIGSYDSGNRPEINGAGLFTNAVQFSGQHHIEIGDLRITNTGSAAAFRRGIYYQAEDMGAIPHVIFRRLEIADVNGLIDNTEGSKNCGGLILEISGTAKATWFDTLIIEDCYIHDVDRTGIANLSTWSDRTLTVNGNWTPSRNVLIRRNIFERTGCNALIVRVAENPLMEHNLFTHCAIKGTGNACFNFNTDGAIWQFNEACYTKYNAGDEDAGGFDSDYRSKNTLIQYNYSHDNEWGAVLLTGGPSSGGGFNDGTIIRYNLFVNNKHHQIKTSGRATNSYLYNNTVYNRSSMTGVVVIWHKSWDGYSMDTRYYNNIFQVMGTGASVDLGGSSGNIFDYNVFYGSKFANEPADAHKMKVNPMLVSPDSAGFGADTTSGYLLAGGSPVINAGMKVPGAPGRDFDGHTVPMYEFTDPGAFEYAGPYGISKHDASGRIRVFPNPTSAGLQISLAQSPGVPLNITIFNLRGAELFKTTCAPVSLPGTIPIPLDDAVFSSGVYLLKIKADGKELYETIFVIQH